MKNSQVSTAVIRRLPRYYRYLTDMASAGILKISSKALADKMGVTASQIRQDFNCFGGFGQQGYGYNVEILRQEIGAILGVDKNYNAVLIGVGNLGHAIANHVKFEKRGIKLIGIFDIDEKLIGQEIKGIRIRHSSELPEFCKEHQPKIAVLTLAKAETEKMMKQLCDLGVIGFWNFANMELKAPSDDITVVNVHLGDSLMTLCYDIKDKI